MTTRVASEFDGAPVTSEEARAMAAEWGLDYAEVSTMDRTSLRNAASMLVRAVMRLHVEDDAQPPVPHARPAAGAPRNRGCVVC